MAMAMEGFVSSLPLPDGDGRSGGDYESVLGAVKGAQEDWQEHEGGSAPDKLLEEFFDILQEDPAKTLEKSQAASSVNGGMDVDGTKLALGPPSWHHEPEIAPHTPAVPEGLLAHSANEATQERSWHHDLNRSGEGVNHVRGCVESKKRKDALRSVFSDSSRDGWSLRSDVQLLGWLEGFTERLKGRTKEVAAEVHRLGTQTGDVELLLQNNFNSLRALSATQFIENRVDEADEVFVNKSEQPTKQSRVESYDSQIIPRYKDAVLTAWDAFEGFSTRKTSQQSSDVRLRAHQAVQSKPSLRLPHIIGTEEFARDTHCGLADFKIPEVNARAPSSESIESGSDTDRDEARMAAEMVGGRTWLGEWFSAESETSGHQGGVLEPAVSAALDFKAMLEAALRGPSFPYDGGIISNLENVHEQHSYVDNALTLVAHNADSNTPRTRSSPAEIKLDEDTSTKHVQTPVEHNTQFQNQGLTSEFLEELNRTVLLQPPPIHMPPAFNRNDSAYITGSTNPQSPSTSTPVFTSSPLDRFPDDPEPSLGLSSPPLGITKIQSTTGPSPAQNLRTEDTKPQPASEFPPSAGPDDLPMPTLPEGLFQGLQVAIQARQLRSQRNEVTQRPDAGEGTASLSAERSSIVKHNRGLLSKSTTSRLQKEAKGVSAAKRTQGPVSFQGGLFDDDDLDEVSDFLSKEGTGTPENGVKKHGENQDSPLTSGSSMLRKGLFDDFGDLSIESPSESEVGASSGLVERANTSTQQSVLSIPDKKDANRSRVLKKSLFGDSDEEDDDLFGEQ